ncbi:MAG: hypothetical protein RBT11_15955 [Desulfobacterales bacterium]|jgi:hypothetical protein|nr:hypothetical protein [Desulfobacterales bacterium]
MGKNNKGCRSITRIAAGCRAASAWLFFVSVMIDCRPALCQHIYRWENDRGEAFYSNVSAPKESNSYPVLLIKEERGDVPSPENAAKNGSAGVRLSTGGMAGVRDASLPSPTDRLRERISSRKIEIGEMERHLAKRSHDERLRRNLMRKKRYLAEELKCLSELNP